MMGKVNFLISFDKKFSAGRQDKIYHYTKLSALSGILESKTLWLFHYKSLEDENELKHGNNIFKKLKSR